MAIRGGTMPLTGGLVGTYARIDRPQEQKEELYGGVDLGVRAKLGRNTSLRIGAITTRSARPTTRPWAAHFCSK